MVELSSKLRGLAWQTDPLPVVVSESDMPGASGRCLLAVATPFRGAQPQFCSLPSTDKRRPATFAGQHAAKTISLTVPVKKMEYFVNRSVLLHKMLCPGGKFIPPDWSVAGREAPKWNRGSLR